MTAAAARTAEMFARKIIDGSFVPGAIPVTEAA